MKISEIAIENILGIEKLEIQPGACTVLSGRNGAGKSSVLAAIKDVLSGGHDPSMIRKGSESGSVSLTLADGVTIAKVIKPDKSTLTVKHPKLGKISKSQAWINQVVDSLTLDPIALLTAKPADRLRLVMETLPLRVEASQLAFLPVGILDGVSLDDHALEVLQTVGKRLYDERTGVNRVAKEKSATAQQIAATLPEEDGIDWSIEHNTRVYEKNQLQKCTKARLDAIKSDLQAVRDAERQKVTAIKDSNRDAIQKQIDELKEQLRLLNEAAEQVADAAIHDAVLHATGAEESVRAEYEPEFARLTAAVQEAVEKSANSARVAQARQTVERFRTEAEVASETAKAITGQLEQLDSLKASLLQSLPVPGLEIADGQLLVDGVPFDRVNTARQYQVAIELGKLRSGELALLLVDRGEVLDGENWQSFKQAAAASKVQIIAARVGSGELVVDTDGEAA